MQIFMLIVVWSYYIITNVLDAWLYVPFSVLSESFSQSISLNREHILSPIFLKISILFNYNLLVLLQFSLIILWLLILFLNDYNSILLIFFVAGSKKIVIILQQQSHHQHWDKNQWLLWGWTILNAYFISRV